MTLFERQLLGVSSCTLMSEIHKQYSKIVQPRHHNSNARIDVLHKLHSADGPSHLLTAYQVLNSLIVLLLAKDRYTFQRRLQPDTLRMWGVMTVEHLRSGSIQSTTAKVHTEEPHRRTPVCQRRQITALVHAGSLSGKGGGGGGHT